MWDSSGRAFSNGKFAGQLIDFGRYEACINIEVAQRVATAVNNQNVERTEIIFPAFRGKYARVFSEFNITELYRIAAKFDRKARLQRLQTTANIQGSEIILNSSKENFHISFTPQGRDDLSGHQDYNLDFASLNITDVLVQDFLLVRMHDLRTLFHYNIEYSQD